MRGLVGFSLTATFSSIDGTRHPEFEGFGTSELYISETASMFASVRDTVMLRTRPSNCTAVKQLSRNQHCLLARIKRTRVID